LEEIDDDFLILSHPWPRCACEGMGGLVMERLRLGGRRRTARGGSGTGRLALGARSCISGPPGDPGPAPASLAPSVS
jgi:hypothetical protein